MSVLGGLPARWPPVLVRSALERQGLRGEDVDHLAVTRGPGLVGCLLVGVGLAQGLGAAWGRPVAGVNHLWGHVYAAMLTRPPGLTIFSGLRRSSLNSVSMG